MIPISSGSPETLVRLAEEKPKPNSDRLKEYRESALQSLELRLFSEAPIYPDYEEARLAQSLAYWKKMQPDLPLVEQVLRGRSPEAAARAFVRDLEAGSHPPPEEARRRWESCHREL